MPSTAAAAASSATVSKTQAKKQARIESDKLKEPSGVKRPTKPDTDDSDDMADGSAAVDPAAPVTRDMLDQIFEKYSSRQTIELKKIDDRLTNMAEMTEGHLVTMGNGFTRSIELLDGRLEAHKVATQTQIDSISAQLAEINDRSSKAPSFADIAAAAALASSQAHLLPPPFPPPARQRQVLRRIASCSSVAFR